ncbi:ribosome 60S biogenesis N-terminal-domain-containing protein [Xylariomycetidae sp. FL0641]|nr:ribosome 60S biogenesis N-terminal-domain-containing protein [Xylariomycetidae sp. FL0641]
MAKRKSFGDDSRHGTKKQKVVHEPPTSEEVYTGRQLRQLLAFEQDLRKARHGLQSFKNLLDSIINDQDPSSEKLHIVLEYLKSEKPEESDDEVPVYFPDIMENWNMASQMGNENVMSAAAVVLALLLKIISGNMDLVPYGLGICRTLLQKRQQELVAKNLSAEKGRDFVISPTLRLLREVISLDGGALAAPVFRARNFTFKSLARNIGLRYLGNGVEDPKRPSVRTNAIRFFLSSLRFLHVEAKRDLLSQKDVIAALMRYIREDPPFLIYEILGTLKESVVLDRKLPKDTKIKILNSHSLTRIASLYGYSHDRASPEADGTDGDRPSVEDAAHELLLAACTDPNAGIYRSEHGYYPEGVEPDELLFGTDNDHDTEFGVDSIPWMNKYDDDIPVRNMLLADFIQTLRPWSNTKQSDLLMAIFEACPELVAQYFVHKKTFTFDPKLTATWMGYAALLYNVVQLPVPAYFGHANGYARLPPPTYVVLNNIIPPPMTPKAMARCLSNKSKLVSFYAIRMLVLALQKLDRALEMYQEAASSDQSVWDEAARRLVDEFYQRIPDLKDVLNCYRTMAKEDLLQREAASRLILKYYEVIPQLALRAKFDVSAALLATIQKVQSATEFGEDVAMSLLELEHLCAIAKYSPSMRWFARPPEMSLSPFTTLLKLYVNKTTALSSDRLQNILDHVAEEYQLVESRQNLPGLHPLLAALKRTKKTDATIWAFLDNCFERCARTPIKYIEMIDDLLEKSGVGRDGDITTCPLVMTIAEQLPFLVSSSPDKSMMKKLAQFLSEYLGCSDAAGVNRAFLDSCKELFSQNMGDKKLGSKITVPSKSEYADELSEFAQLKVVQHRRGEESGSRDDDKISAAELEQRLAVPLTTSKESSLTRWSSKTAEELVEEGYAASLILLLASEHPSLRKEALTNILKMAAKIKESSYEENEQTWLLLMEVAESAKEAINAQPLPGVIVAFASKALEILKNPLHCLYEKVNLFLTSGPIWSLDRIPLMQSILQEGPTEDGTYYSEISWLLGFLLDSLRSPQDVALFHKRNVLESVFGLTANPYLGPNLRTQVLRILYRATTIEGGSTTAVTRFGAVSWLLSLKAAATEIVEVELYQAMIRRLWETCDQERIAGWSNNGVEKLASS